MDSNAIANSGIVADVLVAFRAPAPCTSWDRGGALTPAVTVGAVRPLQTAAKRLRATGGEATYLPPVGSPTSRRPV